jgi:D-3-phosphoglycerate dehydrogenase
MNKKLSFPKDKIKILLLENIHPEAFKYLQNIGYSVEGIGKALGHDELMDAIGDVHVLGIRSKTRVSAEHLQHAHKLKAIGCFGVGTNQVALDEATSRGVPVFNAPYGNTRSVAELAIGNMIAISRRSGMGNTKLHQGQWLKSAKDCHELRGKTVGVVGYGHIGQQVALLCEAFGMKVVFFDLVKRLALGTATQADTFDDLLSESDFISLHVPARADGEPLIGAAEISKMKKGSFLLNLSRGSLVDLLAAKDALESGQLGGVALDVFPSEPRSNNEDFVCPLTDVDRAFLTPHIGGSTEEAQENIGIEVAKAFVSFIDEGSTRGAVNFPHVGLPVDEGSHRILNIHRNVPGVLGDINSIISNVGANINAQVLGTHKDVGYLVMDVNKDMSDEIYKEISALASNIRTRILY